MAIDLDRARIDTRACEGVVHLNNAGASLPPSIVIDTVRDHLRSDEVFGGYEAQELAAEADASARAAVASLVGGRAGEIAFTGSATRAWQSALYSLPWRQGDRVLASQAEYPSNVLGFDYLRERFGVEVAYVPDDEHGQIDVAALASMIDERARLITLTHVPTYSGLINPAAEVGKVARAAQVPYLLDACQSVGQVHLDVEEIGCDLLSAAGRKFLRGPRGTGFLWVRTGIAEALRPPFGDQHSATWTQLEHFEREPGARRFETFERSVALDLGLGAAARYALEMGTRDIEERVCALGAALRADLAAIPGVTVHDRGERLGGIVTFTVAGIACEAVKRALAAQQINVSVTPAGFAMRDFPGRGLEAVVRASPHYYITEDELRRVGAAVAEIAEVAGEIPLQAVE